MNELEHEVDQLILKVWKSKSKKATNSSKFEIVKLLQKVIIMLHEGEM